VEFVTDDKKQQRKVNFSTSEAKRTKKTKKKKKKQHRP
jgi:hypothetical protein